MLPSVKSRDADAVLACQITDHGFLPQHRELLHPGIVEKLADLAREKVRVNAHESLQLAEAALAVAAAIGDPESRARGLRAKANALWFLNQNRAAVELYEEAVSLFERCGNLTEVGRTLSSSIQPLIRLGEYARALAGADQAREIFVQSGDALRLARLDLNVANILHRQDRFREAQAAYEKAYRQLLPLRDAEGIGVALHNMAVCLIGLNDFQTALATHQAARAFCEEHAMPALAAQADYNVAYLYYLRGEYSRALGGLREAEVAARAAGDAYHCALCPMDQSEIYLELNLNEQAAEMAQEALSQFQTLGMNYEAGKCLVNQAIAWGRQGRAGSVELFSQARAIFVREKNSSWPSLIDLYQAVVYFNEGRFTQARPLCDAALEFFRAAGMASKEALCRLLLARLDLAAADGTGALMHCEDALTMLATVEAPHLVQQAHILMGRIAETAGDPAKAMACYRIACAAVEALRDFLRDEELKIAFMTDKLEVYESLVRLYLDRPGADSAREAFAYMEQAKSRSLRDLVLAPSFSGQPGVTGELRRELNWYYHRIELEQTSPEGASAGRLEELQGEARDREKKLVRLLREESGTEAESAAIRSAPLLDVDAVREALDPGTVLVEYFGTGDQLIALVLTAEALEVVPLTALSSVAPIARMLEFQFSKFRLGPEYVAACQGQMLRAAQSHLRELYDALIAPIRAHLRGRHLVMVPHGFMHNLPLHALYDGSHYLCDEFTVSYAPSAAVYALCRRRMANTEGGSLVLGVADANAPLILEEAGTVAAALPDAELYLGSDATQQVLRDRGAHSRFIHIATHGKFRGDNPMFSSIRLGDGYLTLCDLYQLRLPADLVTLSGCSTGLSVVAQGDELLGLVRGLLTAGAKSLLLSLWDVHDGRTAELMQAFYSRLRREPDKAAALGDAMRELRERHPHPYYWAPFVLMGGVARSCANAYYEPNPASY